MLSSEDYEIFCRIHNIIDKYQYFDEIKDWLSLPENVSDYYVWEAGKPSWGVPLLDKIGSKFANTRMSLNSCVLYDPEIIRNFLSMSRDDDTLSISFNNETDDWFSLDDFSQFCPRIGSNFNWKAVFVDWKISAILKKVLADSERHSIFYLRMEKDEPVLSSFNTGMNRYKSLPSSTEFFCRMFNSNEVRVLTKAIIDSYIVPIKEVYMVDNGSDVAYGRGIGRENSDGEYTLTIY